jgi:hypothetical protein
VFTENFERKKLLIVNMQENPQQEEVEVEEESQE